MSWLLAQVEEEIGQLPIIPDSSWWANWGLAGVFMFVVVGAVLYFGRSWWNARMPHWQARWKAEADRELAQAALFDALAKAEPQKLVCQQQQTSLLESIHAVQQKIGRKLGVE